MKVPARGFLIIVAIAISIVTWLSVDVRARLMFTDQYGHIESGSLLGASIGDSWDIADGALQRHINTEDVFWLSGENIRQGGGTMSDEPVLVGESRVSYRDHSWYNGVVTLRLRDGVVTAITWHYPGPFYVDL